MKNNFERRIKEDVFQVDDLVLKWDAPNEGKGKHGKFDHLWVAHTLLRHLEVKMLSFCSIYIGHSMREAQ